MWVEGAIQSLQPVVHFIYSTCLKKYITTVYIHVISLTARAVSWRQNSLGISSVCDLTQNFPEPSRNFIWNLSILGSFVGTFPQNLSRCLPEPCIVLKLAREPNAEPCLAVSFQAVSSW